MIQFEGTCVGVNRRKEINRITLSDEVKTKSMLEFKYNESFLAFNIEVEGQYEMGTKFLMDIYPIPAFKE